MTDEATQPPQDKFNPILLIFLIFPIVGIAMALIIGSQHGQQTGTLVPPPSTYTQFSLVNQPAPDFTLQTPDGKMVQLSSLKGRWVFLNFWASWCAPCRDEMPALQQLTDGKLNATQPVAVLAVNQGEDVKTINDYLGQLKLTLPVVMDSDSQVNRQYGVVQLPITYIIDPKGVVRYQQLGALTPKLIQQYLDDEKTSS